MSLHRGNYSEDQLVDLLDRLVNGIIFNPSDAVSIVVDRQTLLWARAECDYRFGRKKTSRQTMDEARELGATEIVFQQPDGTDVVSVPLFAFERDLG